MAGRIRRGSARQRLSFDLVPQAKALGGLRLAIWLLAGAAVFIVADRIVEERNGPDGSSAALGIVLGSIVDGVPESLIFGITIASGAGVSSSFLAAVIVSNIPQALAPSSELAAAGWDRKQLSLIWGAMVVACGVAAALGYVFGNISGGTGDRMAGFAAGGLLAMLPNSLMPFAFDRGGTLAGLWTVVGFALAVIPR